MPELALPWHRRSLLGDGLGAFGAELPLQSSRMVAVQLVSCTGGAMWLGNGTLRLEAVVLFLHWFLQQWLLLRGGRLFDGIKYFWLKWTKARQRVPLSARFCGKRRVKACRRRRFCSNLRRSWSVFSLSSSFQSAFKRLGTHTWWW